MTDRIGTKLEGYQQLESMVVKQLLDASGAFKGSGASGSDLRMGLFVEALADAVAKSGGFGLAAMLENQIGGDDAEAPMKGAWDDPNSEAALPDGYATPDPGSEPLSALKLSSKSSQNVSSAFVSRALIKYRGRADAGDGGKTE